MRKPKIALQTWTLRGRLRVQTEDTLKRINGIGFRYLELAGNVGRSPEELKELCAKYDQTIVGIHQPFLTSDDLDAIVEDTIHQSGIFDSKFATVMIHPSNITESDYLEYAELCSKAGKQLEQHGIALCYHCYDYDLKPAKGAGNSRSGLDILLGNTECLLFQLDTYFIRRAELSLQEVFAKCGSRCCELTHVNDIGSKKEQAPLGRGTISWESFIPAVQRIFEPSFLVVEHRTTDPLAWIRWSYDCLSICLGDLG